MYQLGSLLGFVEQIGFALMLGSDFRVMVWIIVVPYGRPKINVCLLLSAVSFRILPVVIFPNCAIGIPHFTRDGKPV